MVQYTSDVVYLYPNFVTLQPWFIKGIFWAKKGWDYLQKVKSYQKSNACASPESNRGLNDGNVEFYH